MSNKASSKSTVAKPLAKLNKRNSKKGVVKLAFTPKAEETVADSITPEEKEVLVLEFRLKARKLARSILRKWHARLDVQEIDSLVDLSLCEAVKRFDPTKGATFMTFMFYHLRGNLIRAVTAAASANAIPIELEEGINPEDANKRVSIYKGANAIEIAEALVGHEVVLPDEALYKKELVGLSMEACKKLDNLEKEVIERIYLQGDQLMDIANSLGYSRCHISRVKKKALQTLNNEMNSSLGVVAEAQELAENERRTIHRRRPRSRKAASHQQKKLELLKQAAAA